MGGTRRSISGGGTGRGVPGRGTGRRVHAGDTRKEVLGWEFREGSTWEGVPRWGSTMGFQKGSRRGFQEGVPEENLEGVSGWGSKKRVIRRGHQ